MTTDVKLTDAELLLLDGQCSTEAQQQVDAAKARAQYAAAAPELTDGQRKLLVTAIDTARREKKLIYRHVRIRCCDACGRTGGYYVFKSGRRAGKEDWNRPLSFDGIELEDSFVTITGYALVGGCTACVAAIEPFLRDALATEPMESRWTPGWKRYRNCVCAACHWEGDDHQLGMLPSLMGGGYPGKCPSCGAENRLFGPTVITSRDGYTVYPTTSDKPA